MRFTQAQRDIAFHKLSDIFEPLMQTAVSGSLIGALKRIVGQHAVPYQTQLIPEVLTRVNYALKEFLDVWRMDEVRYGILFYHTIDVSAVAVDSLDREPPILDTIELCPNDALRMLLKGSAPIRLFNPTDENVLINMWIDKFGDVVPDQDSKRVR